MQSERAGLYRFGHRVVPLVRVGFGELDLAGVVEQLRVGNFSGEAVYVKLLERPGEDVQIEPLAVLREAAVGRSGEFALGAAVDGTGVQAHPTGVDAERIEGA